MKRKGAVKINIEVLCGEISKSEKTKELALLEVLEKGDHFTYMHSYRVSEYASCFCEVLGLDDEQKNHFKYASIMHDIGKILIPIDVLYKKDKLSLVELEGIKEHPFNGVRILRRLAIKNPYSYVVLTHHERYDGFGYPLQMLGNDIPILSQVISVCDTLDAMTSLRTYQTMYTINTALDEIVSNVNKQFSPKVIELLEKVKYKIIEKYEYFYSMNMVWK